MLTAAKMKKLQMPWGGDMRPDRILITCAALGLHNVQATQASSSHIVLDIVSVLSVLVRTLSKS